MPIVIVRVAVTLCFIHIAFGVENKISNWIILFLYVARVGITRLP